MRNVEEANHILYGCIVIGSNPILTTKNINMETKQTAVEWLVANLHYLIVQHKGMQFEMMVEKAKAMEKEQIMKAYTSGSPEFFDMAEEYYNETYGNSKTPPGKHCKEA